MTVTELLKMANIDAASHVIYGADALHCLAVANTYHREEAGREEADWAPVSADLIRSNVKKAYRLSGKVA